MAGKPICRCLINELRRRNMANTKLSTVMCRKRRLSSAVKHEGMRVTSRSVLYDCPFTVADQKYGARRLTASNTLFRVEHNRSPRPKISFVACRRAHHRIERIRRVSWVCLRALAFFCVVQSSIGQASYHSQIYIFVHLSIINFPFGCYFLLPHFARYFNPPPDPANQQPQVRPEKLRTSRYSTHLPTARHAIEVMLLSSESSGIISTGA